MPRTKSTAARTRGFGFAYSSATGERRLWESIPRTRKQRFLRLSRRPRNTTMPGNKVGEKASLNLEFAVRVAVSVFPQESKLPSNQLASERVPNTVKDGRQSLPFSPTECPYLNTVLSPGKQGSDAAPADFDTLIFLPSDWPQPSFPTHTNIFFFFLSHEHLYHFRLVNSHFA